jgi:hypothetical protein
LPVQPEICLTQKPTKREIPFHNIARNDELKEFFNKLLKGWAILPGIALHDHGAASNPC